jgi:molybdopterin synthase sulfur carrier subunit
MSVHVYIPTPFRRATENKDRVSLEASDVKTLLDALEQRYGGLKGLVRNEQGEVHRHVNIFVNNEGIDALQGLQTALRDGDEVSIIPALAGGTVACGAAGEPGATNGPDARRTRRPRGR